VFEVFFFRFRSSRARSSRVGVSIPEAFAGIAPDDAPHGRVRLEGRRIDRHGLAGEQSGLDESLLHPREHRPVRLEIDQPSRPRNGRVVRWGLVQR
jgi:hypothetical protein